MEHPPPPEFPASPPLGPPLPPVPPDELRPPPNWPTVGDEPAPPRRPPGWVVVVAVVAVAALVAALFAVFFDGGDDGAQLSANEPGPTTTVDEDPEDNQPGPPPPTTEEAPDPTDPSPVDAVIADIEAFVSEERGLPFLADVTVELADDEEFEARLLEDFEEDSGELALAGEVLIALGLVDRGVDVVAAMRELLGAGVIGFYDTETNELVVRGTSMTPFVRSTIAHELTHALQDQHFELFRPELEDTDDEQGYGFTGLVEGDAERIADAYLASLPEAEQDEAAQEELALGLDFDFAAIPIVLIEQLTVPYARGPELIEAILDAGGQAFLDASFAAPPTTSEHILEPATFVTGDPPNPVAEPVADGEVIDRGVIGLLGLLQLAGESALFGDSIPPRSTGGAPTGTSPGATAIARASGLPSSARRSRTPTSTSRCSPTSRRILPATRRRRRRAAAASSTP